MLDTHEFYLLVCLCTSTWTSKVIIWTASTDRNRATLRASLVVCNRNMSFDDHIQRFIWSLVHGHVLQLIGREGVELDGRRSS